MKGLTSYSMSIKLDCSCSQEHWPITACCDTTNYWT